MRLLSAPGGLAHRTNALRIFAVLTSVAGLALSGAGCGDTKALTPRAGLPLPRLLTHERLPLASGVGVNVKSFGATGHGTTDDTRALRAAIASLPATGGVITIPKGVYLVSSELAISKNGVLLVGEGRDSTVIHCVVPSGDCLALQAAGLFAMRDVTLDGTGAGAGVNGVYLGSGTSHNEFTHDNIEHFQGAGAWGMLMDGSLDNVLFDVNFSGNRGHLRLGQDNAHRYPSNQNNFYSCHFEDNVDPATNAIEISNSEGNFFSGVLLQHNAALTTIAIVDDAGTNAPSRGNVLDHLWMEGNGGGQSDSVNITVRGGSPGSLAIAGTVVRDSMLLSGPRDSPAFQIQLLNTSGTLVQGNYSNAGVPLALGSGNSSLNVSDNSGPVPWPIHPPRRAAPTSSR